MTRKWWPLFLMLLLQLVINPCARAGGNWFLMSINSLAIVAIVYALSFHWLHFVIGALLGIPIIIFYWINTEPFIDISFFIVTGVLYLYALFILVPALLRKRSVGLDDLLGAVALYMLIGLTWAILYTEVAFFSPGAFSKAGGIGEFIYFSFTTLTTLGYGDIVPISCEARVLSSLEAMSGVFCLAVVVARLISLHTASAKSR